MGRGGREGEGLSGEAVGRGVRVPASRAPRSPRLASGSSTHTTRPRDLAGPMRSNLSFVSRPRLPNESPLPILAATSTLGAILFQNLLAVSRPGLFPSPQPIPALRHAPWNASLPAPYSIKHLPCSVFPPLSCPQTQASTSRKCSSTHIGMTRRRK